jgi:crossover junction endodeoxyribonuclease RuvC
MIVPNTNQTRNGLPVRILGIDPGTQVAGYGLLEMDGARVRALCYGVVRASAPGVRALPERLQRVYRGIAHVLATWRPDALAIEEAFVWKNARSALAIGEGRAVAILAACEAGVPIHEYAPSLVKKAVTGRGRATKPQVQAMVTTLLALDRPPEPADAADALAVAFCHVHRARFDARRIRS